MAFFRHISGYNRNLTDDYCPIFNTFHKIRQIGSSSSTSFSISLFIAVNTPHTHYHILRLPSTYRRCFAASLLLCDTIVTSPLITAGQHGDSSRDKIARHHVRRRHHCSRRRRYRLLVTTRPLRHTLSATTQRQIHTPPMSYRWRQVNAAGASSKCAAKAGAAARSKGWYSQPSLPQNSHGTPLHWHIIVARHLYDRIHITQCQPSSPNTIATASSGEQSHIAGDTRHINNIISFHIRSSDISSPSLFSVIYSSHCINTSLPGIKLRHAEYCH
jgi:hypothetical protein